MKSPACALNWRLSPPRPKPYAPDSVLPSQRPTSSSSSPPVPPPPGHMPLARHSSPSCAMATPQLPHLVAQPYGRPPMTASHLQSGSPSSSLPPTLPPPPPQPHLVDHTTFLPPPPRGPASTAASPAIGQDIADNPHPFPPQVPLSAKAAFPSSLVARPSSPPPQAVCMKHPAPPPIPLREVPRLALVPPTMPRHYGGPSSPLNPLGTTPRPPRP